MATNVTKIAAAGSALVIAEPALALMHTGGVGAIVGLAIGAAAYAIADEYEKSHPRQPKPEQPEQPEQKQQARPQRQAQKGPSFARRLVTGKSVRQAQRQGGQEPNTEALYEEDAILFIPEEDELYTNTNTGNFPEQRVNRPGKLPREQTGNFPQQSAGRDPYQLDIATEWHPSANALLGKSVIGAGISMSGKTTLAARIMEQIGTLHVPFVVFDLEGSYGSLVEVLPEVEVLDASTIEDADAAYNLGWYILEESRQIVLELAEYETLNDAATIIASCMKGIFAWANAQPPEERVPCIVLLDEAQHFLPQDMSVSTLEKATLQELQRTVFETAQRGRKRGITPMLFFQSIAEIDKRAIRQAWVAFYMLQTNRNDLDVYERIISADVATREEIKQFGKGQAVVQLAESHEEFIMHAHNRESKHTGHTPGIEAAQRRYAQRRRHTSAPAPARRPLYTDEREREQETEERPGRYAEQYLRERQPAPAPAPAPAPSGPRLTAMHKKALDNYTDGMSYRELGEAIGVGKDKAGELLKDLRKAGLLASAEETA